MNKIFLCLILLYSPLYGYEPQFNVSGFPQADEVNQNFLNIASELDNLNSDSAVFQSSITTYGGVYLINSNLVFSTTTGSYGISFQDGTSMTSAGVGEIGISVNASQFTGTGVVAAPLTLVPSSVTLQGNTFNGNNQLVKLDASGNIVLGIDLLGNAATATTAPNYVLKAGDTMTGPLTISGSSLTVGGAIGAEYYQIDGSTIVAILPGTNSIAYGVGAGENNESRGNNNTFIGNYAGQSNDIGDYNSFMGYGAGYSNTNGGGNSFVGMYAGLNNTTGHNNSFLGYEAGRANISATGNSFIGYWAGYSNTTGNYNSFMGYFTGERNTSGYYNTFLGSYAGRYTTTGSSNTFIGSYAGYGNTEGSYNSFLGYRAGYSNDTGDNNLLLGYQAGDSITSGSDNIIIGYDEDTPSATTSNWLNIGGTIEGEMVATGTMTFVGYIQAQGYSDASPWEDDISKVYSDLNSMVGDGNGNINHTPLAKNLKSKYKVKKFDHKKTVTDEEGNETEEDVFIYKEKDGRNISMTVSQLVRAVQDLQARIKELEKKRIKELEKK